MTNDILLAVDGDDVCALTLLDLSSAFDTIGHLNFYSLPQTSISLRHF